MATNNLDLSWEGPSLLNVTGVQASSPCDFCKVIVPDRLRLRDIEIVTPYERIDTYPDFPGLATTAGAGCDMCRMFRYSIRSELASPGIGAVNTRHPFWHNGRDLILATEWDRQVKFEVRFDMTPLATVPYNGNFILDGHAPQFNGMITQLVLSYSIVRGAFKDGVYSPEPRAFDREIGQRWGGSYINFSILDSPDAQATTAAKKRKLPDPTALSSNNVKMLNDWIHECVHQHSKCSRPNSPWVPTRLLQVDFDEPTGSLQICLIETSDHSLTASPKFAALSHMWGDMNLSPPLRTFKQNVSERKRNIRIDDLPKNFVDAALVCTRMGIRYLWIDSLCIIQDSIEDWKREAATMHLVYRHALVTIVATSATSSHDGFLHRDFSKIPATKIAYSIGDQPPEKDQHRSFIIFRHAGSNAAADPMFSINESKWNTRGWTMQERSLSTRSIHFCQNKIFFECRETILSEENESPQEYNLSSSTLWPRSDSITVSDLYQRWELFLIEYCGRKLTQGTDKLAAIQSVSNEMALVTGHKYIPYAGMWRENLLTQLLWWTHAPEEATRPIEPRAASWSWAALDAEMRFVGSIVSGTKRSNTNPLMLRLSRHCTEVLSVSEKENILNIPVGLHGVLKLRALVCHVSAIRKLDSIVRWRVSNWDPTSRWRGFFPYDIFTEHQKSCNGSGGMESRVFAHGKLDVEKDYEAMLDGLDDTLLYAHIDSASRSTGLLLVPWKDDQSTTKVRTIESRLWKRVGVATLFSDQFALPLEEQLFEGEVSLETLRIV